MLNLDLESIRTFLAVANCNSFNQAAKQVHRSTATVTYRIKSLEKEFGVELIKRSTRCVKLTSDGEYLKNRLEVLINDFSGLSTDIHQMKNNIEQSVGIAVNELLYDRFAVTRLTSYLHDKYPNTEICFFREVYNGVWGSLLSEDSQFAIGAPGWHSISNDLESTSMGEITWMFVASPTHAVSRCHKILSDDELRKFTAINVEDTSRHLVRRKAWLLKGQKELIVPDFETKVHMHTQGIGVGFLPKNIAMRLLNSGQLITRNVANPRSNSPISFGWRKDATGKIISELREMVRTNHPLLAPFCANIDKH
ncbi:LysR family transcriptional regulator [Photobacterium sp.]|uniref:LysR family transcriptional regulator n=1 Tax=Photobacterium sp. TaxID=660 RepID=UPI00299D894F|nr:LysR family transcriptional regulator [Photobacterium sp.]MDX1301448.1 LysR family transcriptional regulator [Photobacterium sp.]